MSGRAQLHGRRESGSGRACGTQVRAEVAHPLVAALILVHHAGLLLLARLPMLALRRRGGLSLPLSLCLLEAVRAEPPRPAAVALRRPRVHQVERVLLWRRRTPLILMFKARLDRTRILL